MSIQRVDKFDYVKLAYADSLALIKSSIDNISENECVIAKNEKVLVIKINGKLYSTQLEEVI